MSSAHASRRPRPPFQRSTPMSLDGMETPLSESTPRFGNSQTSINLVARGMEEKPLPPTPRKPSSVYTVQSDGMEDIPKQSSSKALLPHQTTLQPIAYSASTLRVLDATSKRPKLTQNVQAHAVSDPIVEIRQSQRQYFEKTDAHSSHSPIQRMKSDFAAPSESIDKYLTAPKSGTKGAEGYASNYESLLHTRSSALPTFTPEPYSNYDYLPAPMSSRITDVVDRSLLPSPLSYSTPEEKQRPSSTFSSSSSDFEEFQIGIRNSLRAYARKVLHLPKTSLEGNDRKKSRSTATLETPRISASAGRLPSKNETVASPRRGSIQQGISNMYDTLAKLSKSSQQPNSTPAIDITDASKIRVPRGLRSPAIPMSPYQQLGKKAWQSSKSFKNSQSPSSKSARTSNFSNLPGERTSYFSNPPGERTSYFSNSLRADNSTVNSNASIAPIPSSMARKIASAIHTGTTQVENAMGLNKTSARLAKSERRREELKKMIVVIDSGHQNAGG